MNERAANSLTRVLVRVGDLVLGDGRIPVQSMLSCGASEIEKNISQARELAAAGCDVIRVAIPEIRDVRLISALKSAVPTPIVADIHFDYKIALEAVAAGADKIRINPGNIGSPDRVKAVAAACRNAKGGAGIPIRVGVNSGSARTGIVESALENIRLLEKFDFHDIVVSVKSSRVTETIAAYRELARLTPYPLHLGVTEAGTSRMGLIKSAIGIGSLLADNIGDTIRVSLTTNNLTDEVRAAHDILRAIGRREAAEVISCPTCGRCKIDVVSLAKQVEELVSGLGKPLKIAVMGCAVNGPGECRDADFGITGGDGVGLVFRQGEIVRKVSECDLISALLEELKNA